MLSFLENLKSRIGSGSPLESILVVQSRTSDSRTMTPYLRQTPYKRNTSVSSCYSGLWDWFSTYFHPQIQDPQRDIRNLSVFDSEISIWSGFVSDYSILYDDKWSDHVSETRIKPSCDKILQNWILWTKTFSKPWHGHLTVGVLMSLVVWNRYMIKVTFFVVWVVMRHVTSCNWNEVVHNWIHLSFPCQMTIMVSDVDKKHK